MSTNIAECFTVMKSMCITVNAKNTVVGNVVYSSGFNGYKNMGEWKFWRVWLAILIVEAVIITILRLIISVD